MTRHKVTFVMSAAQALRRVRARGSARQGGDVRQLVRRQGPEARPGVLRRPSPSTRRPTSASTTSCRSRRPSWRHGSTTSKGPSSATLLAKKFGWKVGDKVTLESGIYGGRLAVQRRRHLHSTAKAFDRSTLLFHWDYLNDALPSARRDQVGWIVSRVDDPGHVADISLALDKRVRRTRTPRRCAQDEHSFGASFLAMFSAILKAMDIVSAVILVIMMLILGNTIAMGVRERTNEYGVLRAIGFLPGHVALWIVRRIAPHGRPRGCPRGGARLAVHQPGRRPLRRREPGQRLPVLPARAHQHRPGPARRGHARWARLDPARRGGPSKVNVVDAVRRVA